MILENYPRQPSAFFWTSLELQGATFDRFRPTVPFFFQAEDGIRDAQESRGLGDVYKRQTKSVEFWSLEL